MTLSVQRIVTIVVELLKSWLFQKVSKGITKNAKTPKIQQKLLNSARYQVRMCRKLPTLYKNPRNSQNPRMISEIQGGPQLLSRKTVGLSCREKLTRFWITICSV